jgi:hypothetical protein
MTKSKNGTSASTETPAKKRGRPRKIPQAPVVVDAVLAGEVAKEIKELFGEDAAPIKTVPLEDQSYEELLNKAKNIYRVPATNEWTKGDIIDAIRRKQNGRKIDVALTGSDVAVDELQPGWAEIELFKDNREGARNRPQFFGVNGYRCMVPFGVKCRVPLKVYEVLKNAVETRKIQDESVSMRSADTSRWKVVTVQRFPYMVHGIKDGPDPRPVMEKRKAVIMKPREKFVDIFGYWPDSTQLKEAIKDGVISLKS